MTAQTMTMTGTRSAQPALTATAVLAAATLLALLVRPLALIVGHFHVSTSVANAVVAAIMGGGGWVISAFFPWIIPYVLTVKGLVAVIGVGGAVGW